MKSKYHNKKVMIDGIKFDSKKEANRYQELKLMQRAGIISDLQRQVKYVLIPSQKGDDGRVVERPCTHILLTLFMSMKTAKRLLKIQKDTVQVITKLKES